MPKERLDKFIANRGKGTRSEIKSIIRAGRVNVNGISVKEPEYKINEEDTVTVDGAPIDSEKYVYVMMNKPSGVICATKDKNDRTVINILGDEYKGYKLFPAGRLDKDTRGLVILTNDGDFAHNSLSPTKHVKKRYIAHVTGSINEFAVRKFREGIELKDFTTKEAELIIKERKDDFTITEIVIGEGKFHQIKRMFEAVGCKVVYLKRTDFGSIHLDEGLKEGEYRPFDQKERAYARAISEGGHDL